MTPAMLTEATRPWRYRDAEVGPGCLDENFVYHSWLSSYRRSPRVGRPSSDVYYRAHHPLVTATLKRPSVVVLAAHLPGEDRHVLGWLCFECAHGLQVVHYLYVKSHFRGRGVARGLAKEVAIDEDSQVIYTWESQQAPHLAKRVAYAEYVSAPEFLAMGATPPSMGASE